MLHSHFYVGLSPFFISILVLSIVHNMAKLVENKICGFLGIAELHGAAVMFSFESTVPRHSCI